MRIAPFGYLRINSCLLIPAAFRSLPRPSSAPNAKAFSLRSYQLNHLNYDLNSLQQFSCYSCFKQILQFDKILLLSPDLNLSIFVVHFFPHLHYFVFLFNFQAAYLLGNLFPSGLRPLGLVGTNGLEPSTSRLSGVRSNHLSYAPIRLNLFGSSSLCPLWWR